MDSAALVECVPNFSEGRDRAVIDAIAAAIRSIEGLKLLDVDPGADTNRTVYTFAGSPEAVLEGALAGAQAAWERIDMARHRGAHPRIGALDVCPFVPVSGISMEECAQLAARFGRSLSERFGVPVYLYEKSATHPSRASLAEIREGEYEGLEAKLADPFWKPDFGPAALVPRWGATVTGARSFLVAYNINLNTKDKRIAQDIALSVRESGRLARNADGSLVLGAKGEQIRNPGRLKAVRAIGWYIEEYGCAQVSLNLLDYKTTGIHRVFETVKEEAEKRGCLVTGSELIGLAPLEALAEAGRHFLEKSGRSPGLPEPELLDSAMRSLGLASLRPFDPRAKIVEYAMCPDGFLVKKTLRSFADSVSEDTPAPGGGSVAALAGALGSALAAMVGNLSAKRALGAPVSDRTAELGLLARSAQLLKEELLRLVDEDTRAFDAVLSAMRLPRRASRRSSLARPRCTTRPWERRKFPSAAHEPVFRPWNSASGPWR